MHFFKSFLTKLKNGLENYSFGAVAATFTNIALITGFDRSPSSKFSVIGSLLVIALADNVSDSLGIHIHEEGETNPLAHVWQFTIFNFLARLGTSLVFILIVIIFASSLAVLLSIIYGLIILTIISYLIAKKRNLKPKKVVFEHLAIAGLVIIVSKLLSNWISLWFLR